MTTDSSDGIGSPRRPDEEAVKRRLCVRTKAGSERPKRPATADGKEEGMESNDPFDLNRFVNAQGPVFDTVLSELRAGRKRTHWIWFVFPQLRGLGRSSTAQFYGIGSLDEARAYLAHPELGARLVACTRQVLAVENRSLNAIFGSPDDMKFRSSMTLFSVADHHADSIYKQALERLCAGSADETTLALLQTETLPT
jgi:uncharacterized protein (DUF1810 family)